MKGLVLSGGNGSRLYPSTLGVSKHLLPVFDKPMIYYSVSVLMLAGLQDILLISTERDLPLLQNVLGDGSVFGINMQYAVQPQPNGIAEAFIIGENFISDEPSCLILGDNLFYGGGLHLQLRQAATLRAGCLLFGYRVAAPNRFGVVEFDPQTHEPTRIVEKPVSPPSDIAVTGLYVYDADVCSICRDLAPSSRGELEITDVNNCYLENHTGRLEILGRGIAWLDSGTHESLIRAGHYVQTIQERQGQYIACLEEIALVNGWIDEAAVAARAEQLASSSYGHYLKRLIGQDGLSEH